MHRVRVQVQWDARIQATQSGSSDSIDPVLRDLAALYPRAI